MRAVVMVADGIVYDTFDYGKRLIDQLDGIGIEAVRHDLRTAADPPIADGYVFTGGATSVSAAVPWMARAIDLARSLVARSAATGVPVIGICLGSQIIAEAARPGVTVGASAIEVGLTTVRPPADETARTVVPTFHYEMVSPAIAEVHGVTVRSGNDHSPVQAYSIGETVWAYQYHPELDADDMRRLIDHHADVIDRWGGSTSAAHESVDRLAPHLPDDLFACTVGQRLR